MRGRDNKSDEQIEQENKRAAAIEMLKKMKLSRTKAKNRMKKIYDHLPNPAIEYITSVFLKYNQT